MVINGNTKLSDLIEHGADCVGDIDVVDLLSYIRRLALDVSRDYATDNENESSDKWASVASKIQSAVDEINWSTVP